jgi:hypothetical protein
VTCEPSKGFRRGTRRTAGLTSFAFSAVASLSVLFVRLGRGQSHLVGLTSLSVTFAAVVLVVFGDVFMKGSVHEQSASALSLVATQASGSIAAIAAVHLVIAASSLSEQLREYPAQFVNDTVLTFATLGLVWVRVPRAVVFRVALLSCSFGAVAIYSATRASWHLDPFEGFGVQRYVAAQAAATGTVICVYNAVRHLHPPSRA